MVLANILRWIELDTLACQRREDFAGIMISK